MFEVKDCIGFITNHGAKVISEAINRQFSEKLVTRVQWTAMYFIANNGKMSQKNLAKLMSVSEPTIVHLVDRMESEGYVFKSGDARNYRTKLIDLTEKGRGAYEELFPVVEEFNRLGTADISDEDLNIFKSVLNKMISNVTSIGKD